MQERGSHPPQTHKGRGAELAAVRRSLKVRERVVGEIAQEVEGLKHAIAVMVVTTVTFFAISIIVLRHAENDQRISRPLRLPLCVDDRHLVEQQIGEDRSPHEAEMLGADICRRLPSSLDRYMTAGAV